MTIKLAELLVRHGIVDDSAIEDPQGYDGGRTLRQIAELEKELNESQDVTTECRCACCDKGRAIARNTGG